MLSLLNIILISSFACLGLCPLLGAKTPIVKTVTLKLPLRRRLVRCLWILGLGAILVPQQHAAAQIPEALRKYEVHLKGDTLMVRISLAELLQFTLESNLSLQQAQRSAQVVHSAWIGQRERRSWRLKTSAAILRKVEAGGGGQGEDGETPQFLNLNAANNVQLSAELSRELKNGIQYSLTLTETRSQTEPLSIATADADVLPGKKEDSRSSSALEGKVNIPLFQGWGQEVNTLPEERAALRIRTTLADLHNQERSLLGRVVKLYWQMVAAQETRRIRGEAVALSERLVQETSLRIEAGQLDPIDLRNVESRLAADRQRLVLAENDVYQITDLVLELLDIDELNLNLGLLPSDPLGSTGLELEWEKLVQSALEEDANLYKLRTQLALNRLDLLDAENQLDENLDLSLSYKVGGYRKDQFAAWGDIAETNLHGYNIALTWTKPLGNPQAEEGMRQRNLERERLQLQVNSREFSLRTSLRGLLRRVTLAQRDIAAAEKSVQLSKAQQDREIERLRLGTSTGFLVAQAQQSAAEAEERAIRARVGRELILGELLVLTGTLYPAYNISSLFSLSEN